MSRRPRVRCEIIFSVWRNALINKNIYTYEKTSEPGGNSSDAWFSATQLAEMGLPGMPRSDRRMRDVVEREGWPFREVPSQGGKRGIKREYQPPPYVLALIKGREEGAIAPEEEELLQEFEAYRRVIATGIPITTAKIDFVADYNAGSSAVDRVAGIDVLTLGKLDELLRRRRAGSSSPSTAYPSGLNSDMNLRRTPPQPVNSPDDYVAIPLCNVQDSAGGGSGVDAEPVVDFLHFKRLWLQTELRAAPADLFLITVQGESMEPTLSKGDTVLVDRRYQQDVRDGIYALRMGGKLLIKRLQCMPGGVFKVSSDNPAYQPFEVKAPDLQGDDFAIIGRVVWVGRRM